MVGEEIFTSLKWDTQELMIVKERIQVSSSFRLAIIHASRLVEQSGIVACFVDRGRGLYSIGVSEHFVIDEINVNEGTCP